MCNRVGVARIARECGPSSCWYLRSPLFQLPAHQYKNEKHLCATDQDLVNRNVNQLDEVTNSTHNQESHADSLADLDELALVGLGAALDEERSLTDEVLGNIGELLEGLGHCERIEVEKVKY